MSAFLIQIMARVDKTRHHPPAALRSLCLGPLYLRNATLPFASSSDARAVLRHATRDCHASVDAIFGRFALGEPASYTAFLRAHAAALPGVEQWLDAHQTPAMGDWSTARRAPALLADLAALGEKAPPAIAFDRPGDVATVAGVTYVVEGSRLGGATLSRLVGPDLPHAYLGSPMQMPLWRAFLDGLDIILPTEAEQDRAVEAAIATFAHFRKAGEEALV